MKTLITTSAIALLISIAGTAQAEYIGPSGAGASTVKTLQQSGFDHQFLTLKGHITRRVAHDDLYEFNDGSGTMLVEIDHKHWYWPANTPISDKTTVEIYGKYVRKPFGMSRLVVLDLRPQS